MALLNPYLNFSGNCEEAFNFYKSVFGGEFTTVSRFGEAPQAEGHAPASDSHLIMHIALPIGQGTILMGSDRPAGMGATTRGDNVQLSIQTNTDEESDRIFNGLAAGGQVTMPLEKTFWGARFGMLVDKYGFQWMVNQELAK